MNKKVLIHQPYKYGDYINMMAASQKLVDLGYEVFLPHCFHTKDLVDYLIDGVKTFEIGCVSLDQSESFAKQSPVTK